MGTLAAGAVRGAGDCGLVVDSARRILPLVAAAAAGSVHRGHRPCTVGCAARWVSARRAAAFYRNGLKRMAHDWAGHGADGSRFDDPHHYYAGDLDLFGAGGMFELLSAARTPIGEQTLRTGCSILPMWIRSGSDSRLRQSWRRP
jgi:hypothetical protein